LPNPKSGKIYEGKVVKIMDFGAFVNFFGPRDGLVHISDFAPKRVAKVNDVVKEGDVVKVKPDRHGRPRQGAAVDEGGRSATGEDLSKSSKPETASSRPAEAAARLKNARKVGFPGVCLRTALRAAFVLIARDKASEPYKIEACCSSVTSRPMAIFRIISVF